MSNEIPVLIHPGGIKPEDVGEYGHVPKESDAGTDVIKEPLAGSMTAMCALPGMFTATGAPKFGWLEMRKRSAGVPVAGTAGKVRIPLLDCPDGPG